jgi:hypothetical protein
MSQLSSPPITLAVLALAHAPKAQGDNNTVKRGGIPFSPKARQTENSVDTDKLDKNSSALLYWTVSLHNNTRNSILKKVTI